MNVAIPQLIDALESPRRETQQEDNEGESSRFAMRIGADQVNVGGTFVGQQTFEVNLASRGRQLHDSLAGFGYIAKDARIGIQHIDGRVGFQLSRLHGQEVRFPYVICIEKADVAATGGTDASIA